jgi:hypothetical protein
MNTNNLSDNDRADRLEAALVGLLADVRDYLDGCDRDLEVIVEDITREFNLAAAVEACCFTGEA